MKLIRNKSNVLKLNGEIVFDNSNQIKVEIKQLIKDNELSQLIIDLSGVPLVDSSGIGVFISIFKNLREKNGQLVLTSPTEKVSRVMELTRINQIIKSYDNIEEAEKALADEA